MPGTISVDDLVAFLQRRGAGDGERGGNGRGGGGGGGRATGGSGGGGGRGRGGGDRSGRGRGQGPAQPARGPRGGGSTDAFRVHDWHCSECGEANRHWRQVCFTCRGYRDDVEEPRPGQQRGAAGRQQQQRQQSQQQQQQPQQPTAARLAAAATPPTTRASADTPLSHPGQQRNAAQHGRAASAAGSISGAADSREGALRPGGWAAALAKQAAVHANSRSAGAGADRCGGGASSAGGQLSGAAGGEGAPRARTVALGEASRAAAGADGYVEVRSAARQRDAPAAGGGADGNGGGTATGGGGDAAKSQPVGGPEGDAEAQRGQVAPGAGGDGEEGAEADHGPTEEELKGYWEAAKDLLSFAKKQGYPPEHPIRQNAERQVDETLSAWRAAKPPRAIPTRMAWAEEALQRAKRAQARAEQELDDLDRQYEVDREEKVRVLHEARQRTRERAQKLADLSREAAEEYDADDSACADGTKVLHKAFTALDADVGPALEAAVAKIDRNTEQFGLLQDVLLKVAALHGALGAATGGKTADFFDISAGDAGEADSGTSNTGNPPASDAMDTSETRAPRWMEHKRGGNHDPASTTGASPPRWKKNRADAAEGGATPQAEPAAPTPQVQPAAAASGGAADDDEFGARRAQIMAQATFDGIDVPQDYLRQLCPEALEEWANEHLL